MKKHFLKLIQDTLMNNGKYSRTSLTMFCSFWAGIAYIFYGLVYYEYSDISATLLLGMATGLKGIDVYDKHKHKKEQNADPA